jgi:hypothetical protein
LQGSLSDSPGRDTGVTTKEFIQKSEKFERELVPKAYKLVAAYAGLTLINQITSRIIETQTNAKGQKFPKYSTRPTLSSGTTLKGQHVWRKLASSKEKRRNLKWYTINGHRLFVVPGGYAEIRRLSGELNAYKNFFWTGEMWKKTGITARKLSANGFKIRIAGRTPAAQDKLDWNSEREGINLLDVTPTEEKELIAYVDTWIQSELNKTFK